MSQAWVQQLDVKALGRELKMQLVLIAAMGKNRVIGNKGQMPWHLPADFAYFKRMTASHPMVMGRATFDSLPGVLPGRRHLVITRQANWQHTGCEVHKSVESALDAVSAEPTVMVVGGMQIYEQTLPLADAVLLTEIDHEFAGDRHFPKLSKEQWQEVEREEHQSDEKNGYDYAFVRYQAVKK
jgi:dihydrofolate reductase